ncbi:hypothetical protein [Nonomuraea sp. WAC 01424]|uniref:hypothetical protein n=1 Tax=Nonomuraea sp. WAC 01424 TaxID=2203200 RepID=UPI000F787D6F|nr:hypothetical protein [Nonomuraea sp. WAC 01424]
MMLHVVRAALRFELAGMTSVGLWAARRRHGVPDGATPLSYAKEQAFTLGLFMFAMAVETGVVDLLLLVNDVPSAVRVPVLILDLYSLLFVVFMAAASVTRPHVVTEDELRVRYAAYFDLRVPRDLITSVRVTQSYNENGFITMDGGRLNVAVASRTNVTVELGEPVVAVRPLGRRAEVTSIRFFADDPAAMVAALRSPARTSN